MVDTYRSCKGCFLLLLGLWDCGQRFFGVVHISTGRLWIGRRGAAIEAVALAVDEAELDVGVAYPPLAVLRLLHADRLADQDLADEDEVAVPLDLAVGAHPPNRHRLIIGGLAQRAWIGSRRADVERGRRFLPERLVWPLLVELAAEAFEALLLILEGCGRRRGGFSLEGAMHALVPTVLLRLAGLDPLGRDGQLYSPHRQRRQTTRADRRKGRTVVATDRPRQAELAKCRLEGRAHVIVIGPKQSLAAQQSAAERIRDGQRITTLPVPGAEPALEVHRPYIVGRRRGRERLGIGRTGPPPTALARQPFAPQPIPDRARCRQLEFRQPLFQLHPQLARAPMRIARPQSQHRLNDSRRPGKPMPFRRSAAILQPVHAVLVIARQPLVTGHPAHPEALAYLTHHRTLCACRDDKSHPLVHGTGLFPRHRQVLPVDHE